MPIFRGKPSTCGDCNGTDQACRCCQYGTDADGNALPRPEVTFVYPPIPVRHFDYCATRPGYDEGSPIGYGSTETAAILDLISAENEAR